MKRPCVRHENAQTCEQIVKVREKSTDTWPAPTSIGRHRREWPGVDAERRLPFVCGKHVATGGVR